MKRILMYGICCLLLTFTACQKDDLLTEGIKESAITQRACGTAEFMEKQLQDPEFRKEYEARMAEIEKFSTQQRVICSTPRIVPVAVHYQGINNPDAACLIALAQNQIDILNADYQGSNSDITNWTNNASTTFPGIQNAQMCIQFVLADQNHPAGFGLSDGDLAVTINQTSGVRDNAWTGYINIFVRNTGTILGSSQLPGKGNGDGMQISRTAFGSGSGCGVVSPAAPFNLGRTLTHEMGHYLNLRHIWGDGGCSASDFVQDTPESNAPNYNCPNIGKSACGSADLHMNYMDYTNDACMYMFTEGQAVRAENLLNGGLQNVLANGFVVVSSSPAPTCTDGVRNGGETGIDCGGPCGPCGQTCDNGIKDGDETGVDCGGSCPNACPSNGGNNPCLVTGKYVNFAVNNADQVREIATIISNSNDPEVKALVRKMVKHQDELLVVVDQMNNDANARKIMNNLIADYKAADKNDLKVSNETSAQLVQYLNIAKKYTSANSELNTVIDEAINMLQ
ncbi:MAG: M43 family zinc metalloprotease [Chitinophagales bacterium]